MRVTKEVAARNRERILETATQLFKVRGIDSVSLADLMKAAGFTHGGFYNHFASKAELAVETIRYAFDQSLGSLLERAPAAAQLDALRTTYLSAGHRDEAAGGCPTGSLPVDVARQPAEAQRGFADGLERYVALIARGLPSRGAVDKRGAALVTLSTLVGAIVLSRSVREGRPDLSDEILRAARDSSHL